ncbi:MAG: hypothetical protein ISS70_06575 [Phycisphaerae bacterium]|nr:hypothetical protein [Phycisphaerae bacterium]
MASLVVVTMILGCAALLYFKGTFVKAFAAIIIAIISGMVAFGFFEAVANMFISRGDEGMFLTIAPWAQTTSFILIFVVVFAVLQAAATCLLKNPVDLGFLPECIGRIACGTVLGFLVSGFLLTALAMGPFSLGFPYQRFDPVRLKPDNPKGALLGADGFATGLFTMVSKGSFSGKRSFATIHPNYLDQLFFNRLINTETTSIISSMFPAISVPRQAAVWRAPQDVAEQADGLIGDLRSSSGRLKDVKDAQGKPVSLPVSTKGSYDVTIVRVGISKRAIRADARINGGAFTPSQLRLICKRKGTGQDRFAGEAVNVYPIGHLRTASQIQVVAEIKLDSRRVEGSEQLIDFVFCVPTGHEPVVVQYKLNSIAEIAPGAIVTDSAKIPAEPATFNASSGGNGNRSNNRPNRSSNPPREQPRTQTNPQGRRGLSDTGRSIVGTDFDEQ